MTIEVLATHGPPWSGREDAALLNLYASRVCGAKGLLAPTESLDVLTIRTVNSRLYHVVTRSLPLADGTVRPPQTFLVRLHP